MSMMPTMNLRFVKHETTSNTSATGDLLSEGFSRTVILRVLQQQFVSVTSPDSEWRDVPLVELESNVGIEPPYSVGSNDGLGPF